jgi:hypothetical protein
LPAENGYPEQARHNGINPSRVVARLAPARGAPSLKGLLADVAMSAAEDQDLFSTGLTWDLA